jgi:galactokinase
VVPGTGAELAERLRHAGLSAAAEQAKARLFDRALAALGQCARGEPWAWWVPGRVEFLGKHTDYAGGRSLLCAAERGFAVAAIPRSDDQFAVVNADSGDRSTGPLTAELRAPMGHWTNYPFTVARRIALNFPGACRGLTMAFASDLPSASGLSSSSALVVATFLAVAEANALYERADYTNVIHDSEDLAGYLGEVENGRGYRSLAGDLGVGTAGGSEDHTAILNARCGELVQYRFAPVQFERAVPFPAGHVLVIASSGVAAPKTGSALEQYNATAGRAAAVMEAWRAATGGDTATLGALVDGSPDRVSELLRVLASSPAAEFDARALMDRAEQFIAESTDIIPAAADALAHGDLGRLGDVVDRSQHNVERWLGNQVPETVMLARSARELGAVAASAFGAGFGGSVYALVAEAEADAFRSAWSSRYAAEFPRRAGSSRFFVTKPGPAARRV